MILDATIGSPQPPVTPVDTSCPADDNAPQVAEAVGERGAGNTHGQCACVREREEDREEEKGRR